MFLLPLPCFSVRRLAVTVGRYVLFFLPHVVVLRITFSLQLSLPFYDTARP